MWTTSLLIDRRLNYQVLTILLLQMWPHSIDYYLIFRFRKVRLTSLKTAFDLAWEVSIEMYFHLGKVVLDVLLTGVNFSTGKFLLRVRWVTSLQKLYYFFRVWEHKTCFNVGIGIITSDQWRFCAFLACLTTCPLSFFHLRLWHISSKCVVISDDRQGTISALFSLLSEVVWPYADIPKRRDRSRVWFNSLASWYYRFLVIAGFRNLTEPSLIV